MVTSLKTEILAILKNLNVKLWLTSSFVGFKSKYCKTWITPVWRHITITFASSWGAYIQATDWLVVRNNWFKHTVGYESDLSYERSRTPRINVFNFCKCLQVLTLISICDRCRNVYACWWRQDESTNRNTGTIKPIHQYILNLSQTIHTDMFVICLLALYTIA